MGHFDYPLLNKNFILFNRVELLFQVWPKFAFWVVSRPILNSCCFIAFSSAALQFYYAWSHDPIWISSAWCSDFFEFLKFYCDPFANKQSFNEIQIPLKRGLTFDQILWFYTIRLFSLITCCSGVYWIHLYFIPRHSLQFCSGFPNLLRFIHIFLFSILILEFKNHPLTAIQK